MNNQINSTPAKSISTFFYGYKIVIACFLIRMVTMGLCLSAGVFFKPMMIDLGVNRAGTAGPFAFSAIATGLISIFIGLMNEKHGPKRVTIVFGILTATGLILMSQVTSIWQVYLYYGILVGAGTALLTPMLSTVARWFTSKRTLMTGIVVASGGLGGLSMPFIANKLITMYDWKIAYVILGSALLLIILVASTVLKNPSAKDIETHPLFFKINQKLISTTPSGLTLADTIRKRQFWIILLSFLCFGIGMNSILVHIAPHVNDIGFSTIEGTAILAAICGVSIIGSSFFAGMGDRIGNKRALKITFIIMAATFFLLPFINALWMFYIYAILFGLAYGSGVTQQSPMVARIFSMSSHSLILGIMYFGLMLGSAIGGFLPGLLFDLSGNYNLAFFMSGIICMIGLVIISFLKPIKSQ